MRFIFLTFILISILLSSCHKTDQYGGLFKKRVIYVNESGHNIVIERQINEKTVVYQIGDNQSLIFEMESESSTCYVNGNSDNDLNGSNCSLSASSNIKIIFEGLQPIEFKESEESELERFNILALHSYEAEDGKKLKVFQYTFTQEFYEAVSSANNTDLQTQYHE